jgi:hypothetical protein
LAGSSALEWISWPSTLGMLVGFVLYGSATLQARVVPRWHGLVLLASMPISLPLEVYWTALFGLILVVLEIRKNVERNKLRGAANTPKTSP